jgi:hypothetical protein
VTLDRKSPPLEGKGGAPSSSFRAEVEVKETQEGGLKPTLERRNPGAQAGVPVPLED